MTGKVAGGRGRRKNKQQQQQPEDTDSKETKKQKKPKEEHRIDLSTMLYLTQSVDRLTARVRTLALHLGSLRLNRFSLFRRSDPSLLDDIQHVNMMTRSNVVSTCNRLRETVASTKKALAASILLDACLRRHVYIVSECRDEEWPDARFEDAPCTATITDLHSSFLYVLVSPGCSIAGRPLAHMIRKVLPRRSAARKYNTVMVKYMKASKTVERVVFGTLMASLIGNYKHSTRHISFEARMWLRDMFDDTPLPRRPEEEKERDEALRVRTLVREKLIHWCPALFKFAVRDHLIHLLEDDLAAKKHFDARYGYASFVAMTTEAIDAVRDYIERNLQVSGTLLPEHLQPPVGDPQIKIDLKRLFGRIHSRMLNHQAQPAPVPFFEFLGSMRNQIKPRVDLVEKQIELHKHKHKQRRRMDLEAEDEEEEEDFKDDLDEDEDKQAPAADGDDDDGEDTAAHHFRLLENCADIGSLDRLMREMNLDKKAKPKPVENKTGVRLTKQGVTYTHSRAWHALFERLPPDLSLEETFHFVLAMLPYFTVEPDAIHELRRMQQLHLEGTATRKIWHSQLGVFAARFPTAWSNIVAAWITRCAHSSARLFALDRSMLDNQVEAIASRFGCPPSHLPSSATSLCVCLACRKVRSLVREPAAASTKPGYIYGLKDVGSDLFTGKLTCRNAKAFMHLQCKNQHLSRVNLLGFELGYRRRRYLHCPQKKCGFLFQYHPQHAAFPRGQPACPTCTLEMARATHKKVRKEHPFAIEQKFKCFLCDKKLVTPGTSFIFAKDTVICSNAKHGHRHMVDFVAGNVPGAILRQRNKDTNAALAVRKAMLDCREKLKDMWAARNARRNNSILKLSKKNKWIRSKMR